MSVTRRVWFERPFPRGLPAAAFPDVLERLRGTPARLEERVRQVPAAILVAHENDRWSIQQNVGHLADLEPLWAGRLDDFDAGLDTLRPADLTNRTTDEAGHDDASIAVLLGRFRSLRSALVARLEDRDGAALARTALHPRLRQPMSVVDLCFFVAEHDDHHLARITELLRDHDLSAGTAGS